MQVIYAGLRNGQRDQAIHDALQCKHVAQVAEEFRLSPNTIRRAAKRIEKVALFDLSLLGGVSRWRSVGSPPTRSARLRLAHTGTTAAPSRTWTCPAG